MTKDSPLSGTRKQLRVLVVDNSATQRGMLINLLESDQELKVAGWAANGKEAIKCAELLKPDVITMEFRMPVMDGLQATQRIMQQTPIPIVMVTTSSSSNTEQIVFAAIQAGVMATVAMPMPGSQYAQGVQELLRTVKSMAEIKLVRRWTPERIRALTSESAVPVVASSNRALEIVAIGASTGGPPVLQQILTQLPAAFTLPVLVVQHIAADFVTTFVDWLRPQCRLPVQIAGDGVSLSRPGIYFAPQGQHLRVYKQTLALTSEPPIRGHRPSVTALFESVATYYGKAAIGVLLTGMGDDGAIGMHGLKKAGALTVAQDEASSVVFSMPALAIDMGVVDYVLPPPAIATLLVNLAGLDKGAS
ncbi:MAG: two-component system, chemotaxis family, response regulator CheB [Chloroflexi bacterium]|nr:two-component system, chemotaxis family, response regulator CheB [Chloroflexota bacterium]